MYSPDLAPSDFELFPRKVDILEGIQAEFETALNTFTEEHFRKTFEKWCILCLKDMR